MSVQHTIADFFLRLRLALRPPAPADGPALLKADALQRAIFNSANFSSIATDAQGVIQIFNVGAERMLGYAAAGTQAVRWLSQQSLRTLNRGCAVGMWLLAGTLAIWRKK